MDYEERREKEISERYIKAFTLISKVLKVLFFVYLIYTLCYLSVYFAIVRYDESSSESEVFQMFERNSSVDLYFYVSANKNLPNFSDPNEFVWLQTNLVYGNIIHWFGLPTEGSSFSVKTTISSVRLQI